MTAARLPAVDRAEPDWLAALRACADEQGQRKAAKAIGYGVSTVSQVLGGSYKGNLRAVRAACEGAFLHATVHCPALGFELRRDVCGRYQRRDFAPTSPEAVRVWTTCRSGTCPHSKVNETKEETC